jgi:hypothetical protein
MHQTLRALVLVFELVLVLHGDTTPRGEEHVGHDLPAAVAVAGSD